MEPEANQEEEKGIGAFFKNLFSICDSKKPKDNKQITKSQHEEDQKADPNIQLNKFKEN